MRRRLDGGMLDAEGEWPSLSSLVSSVRSSDAMDERGEPGESAIVLIQKLGNEIILKVMPLKLIRSFAVKVRSRGMS